MENQTFNPVVVYKHAGKQIALIENAYKRWFVNQQFALGCSEVSGKGLCNHCDNCDTQCPLKQKANLAIAEINSGAREDKKPNHGRYVSNNEFRTQVAHVYETPKARIAATIESCYNESKAREIYFSECQRCKSICKKYHAYYNCDTCMVRAAFRDKMLKFKKEN